mmetsp:Transcript_22043/g.39062  ORF Transcript_22043/g.39062 Transcript_22043/m.39062 type:complete len:189 (-) Transcript_22043:2164-2730(-)
MERIVFAVTTGLLLGAVAIRKHKISKRSAKANVLVGDIVGPVKLRLVHSDDKPQWLALWHGYLNFYRVELSKATTEHTWDMISNPSKTFRCLVAMDAVGQMLGFATFQLQPTTWDSRPACYLEDLFVQPGARNLGIGRKLIQALAGRATEEGWCRLYWVTNETNYNARKLYDKVAKFNDYIQYRVPLN